MSFGHAGQEQCDVDDVEVHLDEDVLIEEAGSSLDGITRCATDEKTQEGATWIDRSL